MPAADEDRHNLFKLKHWHHTGIVIEARQKKPPDQMIQVLGYVRICDYKPLGVKLRKTNHNRRSMLHSGYLL
jgi:hypothetical protein